MEKCGQWMPTPLQDAPKLFTADGSQLEVKGRKTFKFWLPTAGFEMTVPFVVCNVSRPILSVMRLAEKGCTVEFGMQGATLKKEGDSRQAKARLHRGQYLLDVQGCSAAVRGGLVATATGTGAAAATPVATAMATKSAAMDDGPTGF